MPKDVEYSHVRFIPGCSTGLGRALAQAALESKRNGLSYNLRQWETVTVGTQLCRGLRL